MAYPRLPMRKIREVLRRKYACGQSERSSAQRCGVVTTGRPRLLKSPWTSHAPDEPDAPDRPAEPALFRGRAKPMGVAGRRLRGHADRKGFASSRSALGAIYAPGARGRGLGRGRAQGRHHRALPRPRRAPFRADGQRATLANPGATHHPLSTPIYPPATPYLSPCNPLSIPYQPPYQPPYLSPINPLSIP